MKKLIFVFVMFMSSSVLCWADIPFDTPEEVEFSQEKQFDVYYEVSESLEVDKITRVYVRGVVTVGSQMFLNIVNGNYAQGNEGYIRLDSVRAILPTAMPIRRKIGAASVQDSSS